jgi:cytoskeletal protein CcmA (bactofilin family)
MWRKPADAKANPQSSTVPEPVPAASKAGQTSTTGVTATPTTPAPIAQSFTQTPAQTPAPSVPANLAAHNASISTAAARANSASLIGAGLKIQGEITGDSDLVIEGEAHGRIRMVNGRVTVAASGRVNADIEAVEISVDGFVQGGLKASDRVRLGPASQVQGSVMTPRIAIEDGARLRGKVEMIRAGEVAAPAAKTLAANKSVSTTPATTPSNAVGANSAAAKSSDAATPGVTSEADRLKATAARGSGD